MRVDAESGAGMPRGQSVWVLLHGMVIPTRNLLKQLIGGTYFPWQSRELAWPLAWPLAWH